MLMKDVESLIYSTYLMTFDMIAAFASALHGL